MEYTSNHTQKAYIRQARCIQRIHKARKEYTQQTNEIHEPHVKNTRSTHAHNTLDKQGIHEPNNIPI